MCVVSWSCCVVAAATPPVVSAAWTAPCLMVETVVEAVDEAAEATSLAFFLMKLKLGMVFLSAAGDTQPFLSSHAALALG